MSWIVEVLHIARKDVRQLRWFIAAYALLIAMFAFAAVRTPASPWLLVAGPIRWLLEVALVAVLIQSDSPYRADAFWPSRPLRASAVFGAKLLVVAIMVVGTGLLGQTAVLLAYDTEAHRFPGLLAGSAVQSAQALAIPAVVAAITPSLAIFLVVFAVGYIAFGFVFSFLVASSYAGPGSHLWFTVLVIGASFLVLAWQYRTRNRRQGIALALGLLVLTAAPTMLVEGDRERETIEPPASARAGIRIPIGERRQPVRVRGNRIDVPVELVGGSDAWGYVLREATLHIDDTRALSTRIMPGMKVFLNDPKPSLDGIQWLDITPRARMAMLSSELGIDIREPASGRRITVDGMLEVRAPRVAMSVPLRAGASKIESGHRLDLVYADADSAELIVELRHHVVAPNPAALRPYELDNSFAVVHRERGEGFLLRPGTSHSSGGLLLSDLRVNVRSGEWSAGGPVGPRSWTTPGWLDGAELIVFEWDLVGRYPVQTETTVPD